MTDETPTSRRRFLLASATAVGMAGLAGCPGDGEETTTDETTTTASETPTWTTTTEPTPTVPPTDVTIGEPYQGNIVGDGPRDPRFNGLATPVTFATESGAGLRITLGSRDFDAYLLVTDPDGTVVAQNDDSGAPGDTDSRIAFVPQQSGRYTAWAGSLSGSETGAFTLTVQAAPELTDGANLRSIEPGETRQGEIDFADPIDPVFGWRGEPVTFDGEADQAINITMASKEFDTYLLLVGPDGRQIAENDDDGTSTDSEMIERLPVTGTYTIWALSLGGFETGSYSLTLQEETIPDQPDLREIAIGESREGYIDLADPRDPFRDWRGEPVTFDGQAGQTVTISMDSPALDSFLLLLGPDGEFVGENDDSGGDFDSELAVTLPTRGTYTVWALSVFGNQTGPYTLTVAEGGGLPPGEDDLREIAIGESREGYLDANDPPDPEYGDVAEPVTFVGEAGQTVTIEMRSRSFDTYIVFYGPSGLVTEADDSGTGTDTRLTVTLPESGEYTIWAGSAVGFATGPYTLSVSEASAIVT